MSNNMFNEIRALIAEITEVDEEKIHGETRLVEDLDVDSMLALEILVAVEKKYDVKIPEDRITSIKTLNDTLALAEEYVQAGGAKS